MTRTHWFLAATALLALTGAETAAADVPAGIAAWQAGDYARAVAEWRPLAEAGDADAQFNLGQAYRLGRGVPQDMRLAEQWFERAARQRHDQAGANLGLLLFQNGRAREAMPWIQAAAMRGDPRAQYVFGTALFNGDVVRRDMARAYAMMSRAAAQGFPQAVEQLRQMEPYLSAEDRQRGTALAAEMGGAQPPHQVAAVEPPAVPVPAITARPGPSAGAGVSYAPPAAGNPPARPRPDRPGEQLVARQPERRAEAAPARPAPTPAPAAASGRWRVQLGAFSSAANARRQWDSVSRRVGAVGALEPAYVPAGALTRLRAGPLASRAAADRICAAVRAAGEDCILVAP
ncbi:MAG: SPOR domain-containing protein [Allosphingosinicella sp.]|uniref:SPOR domain-containing protein n=1 Tax=Allosphingosinicella sp. TaxID=2823234 RepID=UPI00392E8659